MYDKIKLFSSRVGLPGTPVPLPLGEVSPQVTERVPSREKVDRENPQIFPIYKL